jgi:hypothetical protein
MLYYQALAGIISCTLLVCYMYYKYLMGRHITINMLKQMNMYRVIVNNNLLEKDTKYTKLLNDEYDPPTLQVIADYFHIDVVGNLLFYKRTNEKESEIIYAIKYDNWFDCLMISKEK